MAVAHHFFSCLWTFSICIIETCGRTLFHHRSSSVFLLAFLSLNAYSLNARTRMEIQADAQSVDLRSRCPFFYEFGCKLAPL